MERAVIARINVIEGVGVLGMVFLGMGRELWRMCSGCCEWRRRGEEVDWVRTRLYSSEPRY
jgi:hypothetical protein